MKKIVLIITALLSLNVTTIVRPSEGAKKQSCGSAIRQVCCEPIV